MEKTNDNKGSQTSMPSDKGEANKAVKDYWFFVGPSLLNLAAAIAGITVLGIPALVSASIFILVGIVWAIAKDKKQGLYMVLSGVVVWLIGFSICGYILANH